MDKAQVNDTAAPTAQPAPAKKPEKENGSADGSKRRALRRDPEKRRLQNIQAQKKYRELMPPLLFWIWSSLVFTPF